MPKNEIDDHSYCIECDCILTQYENDTCCWCLERIQKENSNAKK